MQRTGGGGGGGGGVLELNCEGLMDKTTGDIIQCTKCAHKHANTVQHSLSSPQPGLGTVDITWNRDTIIPIGIN